MVAFAMLVAGGYALPQLPLGASTTARALNLAVAEHNACGGELGCLVAPAVGGAIPVGLVEHFIVGAILEDQSCDVNQLADRVITQLARGGRAVMQDGQPVTEPEKARRIIADIVRTTLTQRGRAFRLLGILDD
jgi:hypothetical protein